MRCCKTPLSRPCCFLQLSRAWALFIKEYEHEIDTEDMPYLRLCVELNKKISEKENADYEEIISKILPLLLKVSPHVDKYLKRYAMDDHDFIDYIHTCALKYSVYARKTKSTNILFYLKELNETSNK